MSTSRSILWGWVEDLGLRHQGVILTAIRGCDGVAKHDVSKPVMRAIRAVTLIPFDARELSEPKGFMYYEAGYEFRQAIVAFAKNMDEYPSHFVWHVIHACEVIGYCHGWDYVREDFRFAYGHLIKKFHVNPESKEEMEARLTEDRVASNTVAG